MITQTEIQCRNCGLYISASEFYSAGNPRRPEQRRRTCKICDDTRRARWFRRDTVTKLLVGPDRKQCRSCGEIKRGSEFHRHRRSNDGRQSYCKACAAEKRRQWRANNRERDNVVTKLRRSGLSVRAFERNERMEIDAACASDQGA